MYCLDLKGLPQTEEINRFGMTFFQTAVRVLDTSAHSFRSDRELAARFTLSLCSKYLNAVPRPWNAGGLGARGSPHRPPPSPQGSRGGPGSPAGPAPRPPAHPLGGAARAGAPGPARSRPLASRQTEVGEVLFKFQRQLLGSFAETITLLLGTNVDI